MSNTDTYCIIMAGGPGSRFWPLSTEEYPKQFIDLLGIGETLIQRTFRRCCEICPRENIIIVCSADYGNLIHQQISNLNDYQVLCEPTRRNTAPCIAYAAAIIYERNPHATVFVTPSDHFITDWNAYVDNLRKALDVASQHDWIITFGARPTNPNTKYGYIQLDEDEQPDTCGIHRVVTFTEKPPLEVACQFIATGEFYWNVGIFVWRLDVLMEAFRQHLPTIAENFFHLSSSSPRDAIDAVYSTCETISVDHGIIEPSANVYGIKVDFGWSDVETWDALYNSCQHDDLGNAFISGKVFAYDTHNSIVHVPLHKTVVLQGLDGYVITENHDTLMICQRSQEERHVKFMSDVELSRAKEQ